MKFPDISHDCTVKFLLAVACAKVVKYCCLLRPFLFESQKLGKTIWVTTGYFPPVLISQATITCTR